uniref:Uncharacterized protein n=1 Tax=Bacteriophage sp. TaxID=38018 RepID=A0A7G9A4K9_9VIRU|nr:MAG: hypothetical protein [Bacteriophage sp.]
MILVLKGSDELRELQLQTLNKLLKMSLKCVAIQFCDDAARQWLKILSFKKAQKLTRNTNDMMRN